MIMKQYTTKVTFPIICILGMTSSLFSAGGGSIVTSDPTKHFDPKGKLPSTHTVKLQNSLRKTLPFEDKRDFDEAKKGFIAAPKYKQIMADAGHVACTHGKGNSSCSIKIYQ
jgi:alkyl sulfatase BDS1-like metallo-beta-lactamase superfamily hydrolase